MNSFSVRFSESFNHSEIEKNVEPRAELYPGLPEEALYTSHQDLDAIFDHPCISGSWIDLGAGVGKSVFQYATRFPEREAIGIECSKARVEAGQSFLKEKFLKNAKLILDDLLTSEIPRGDVYFLYFPTGPVLDRILSELSRKSHALKIVAIESHGDLLPRIRKENWLTLKSEIPLSQARHHPMAQIFESNGLSRDPDLSFYDLSFQNKHLLIADQEKTWLGESFGMSEIREDEFNLAIPPRTIHRENVLAVLEDEDLPADILSAVKLRRESVTPSLRKIFVSPGFSVEISTGETIEWGQFKVIN